MRNQLKIVYGALTLIAMIGLTSSVHAVPSFARQTGLDCSSCHAAIGFPSLNTFGQAFRAGGYTQANDDDLIGDGEALSIPKSFNLSVITKMRLHGIATTEQDLADPKTTVTTNKIEGDLPDEWAIWLAGRAGKNVGFATEFGINPGGVDYAFSFKMPIVYDVGPIKAGFVPYWTDAQGPGWGFETLSTGAVGNIKMFEMSYKFTPRMYLDEAGLTGNNGEAVGASLYVWHPMFNVAYSPYLTAKGGGVVDPSFAHYLRGVFTPSFGGIDLALGAQVMLGNMGQGEGHPVVEGSIGSATTRTIQPVNYIGFDAQVMGTFGIPMMLVVNYGMADNLKDMDGNVKAGTKAGVLTALVNFTIIPDLLNIGAGARFATITNVDIDGKTVVLNDGSADYDAVFSDNAAIVEVKFNLARNLRLSLTGIKALNAVDVATDTTYKITTINPDGSQSKEDKLTVMLFGGF